MAKKEKNTEVKRVIDMTSDELSELIRREVQVINDEARACEKKEKKLLRGYKELAGFLKCSVPTACRMVSRGDIHTPAIIRANRTILFNVDLVLEQLLELENKWAIGATKRTRC